MNNITENTITLNFLPLNTKEFSFQCFRKKIEKEEDLLVFPQYVLRDADRESKDLYHISFNEVDNFEKYLCKSTINTNLTKYYLLKLLENNSAIQKKYIEEKKDIIVKSKDIKYILEENPLGYRIISMTPYYLKGISQYGYLIDYRFIRKKGIPFDRKILRMSLSMDEYYRSNSNYHIDKYSYITSFIEQNKNNLFKLNRDIYIENIMYPIESYKLKVKKYIVNNNEEGNSQYMSIITHGPYKNINGNPRYYFIFKEEHRQYVNNLIEALNGNKYSTFPGIKKFNMQNITKDNVFPLVIDNFDYTLNEDKINNLINERQERAIAIFIFPEKEEKYYYEIKWIFINKNIPTQGIHTETIFDENQLKWSISSIALQLFSKLGGIPWRLVPSNERCLIIGMGQSIKRDTDTKKINKYYAYSILIDSSGEYKKLVPLADAETLSDYIKAITTNVIKIIYETNEYRKITIHVPQKIPKEAIDNLKKVLEGNNQSRELVIIRINDKSKFFGYNIQINSLIPFESSYIKLSNYEYLLWTEGLSYHNRKAVKRYANPLYIDFIYSKNQINHNLYLQDILNLSGANWRGFNAKNLPISIFYPQLISRFNKYFSLYKIDMLEKESDIPWFL